METVAIETWLKSTLEADTQLRSAAPAGVHADMRRSSDKDPKKIAVVWTQDDAGTDDVGMCGTRHGVHPVYLVRAVSATSSLATLGTAATRIDALLDNATATLTINGTAWKLFVTREQEHRQPSFANGQEFYELGGRYRFDLARQG